MSLYSPFYQITSAILSQIETITELKIRLEQNLIGPSRVEDALLNAQIDSVHFSTKIEGNKLTRDQVTQILSQKSKLKTTHDVKEVINYSLARRYVYDSALRGVNLSAKFMHEIHDKLMQGIVRGKLKGHWRQAQNAVFDAKSRKIVYLPPESKDVSYLINQLIQWTVIARRSGVSSLIIAPLFHFQFVTIHPYMDGNGRLARLLTHFLLLSSGHESVRFTSIEKQHEADRGLYYKSLHDLQGQNFYDIPDHVDLTSWLDYWLKCCKKSYQEACERLIGVQSFPSDSKLSATDRLESARVIKGLQIFKQYQKISAKDYQILLGLGRTQAVHDLNLLIEKKMITAFGGGRSRMYQLKLK